MKCTRKVSQLDSFVKGFEQQAWFVGIDVHKRSYAVAIRRVDGQIYTWTSPAEPQALLTTFNRHGITPTRVVQEAGPTGYHLPRAFTRAGIDVRVAAPSKVPRPVSAGAKSDRLDCRKLAEYAARDMITGIAIPTCEEELFRGIVRQREELTRQIRKCKQKVRAALLFHEDAVGLELPSWSQSHIDILLSLEMPCALRFTLESLVAELRGIEANRTVVTAQIEELLCAHPIWKQRREMMMTVPGVGPCISAVYLAELFQPERFQRGEQVSSYVGLAPMVHHSGEKTPRGRIRPVGQKHLRSLLIEASWSLKERDPGMQKIYNTILARTGVAQKAIVAVARRLAVILWRIVLENRPYYSMPE